MKLEEFRDRQKERAASEDDLRQALERELRVIGQRLRRTDALGKCTGRAVYADDIVLPGMLHGKILRSPYPHARITSIDTSKALALDGVHAVIAGRDMPVAYGIIPWTRDEYPLCVDKVRYVGDGVAAVAAIDEDTANRALDLIEVEYEILPHTLDPEEALAHPENPIHEPRKPGENGNLHKHVHLEFGDVDGLLSDSDVVIEGEYYFEGTTHTPIEPHCAVGYYDPSGKLIV
ncbi:MAG: molybdopterin-dependent oxidoreductase, partial [Gemmatimonadetes bacterium]|nr:molybdopterin-dependent oxidoreductase [Gemmatimonadota bacterium]